MIKVLLLSILLKSGLLKLILDHLDYALECAKVVSADIETKPYPEQRIHQNQKHEYQIINEFIGGLVQVDHHKSKCA